MPNRPGRRRFLVESGLTVLGVPMLAACTRSDEPRTPAVPATLIAWIESEVPRLLASSRVPGLAIALVGDGRVAWYRGFGVRHSGSAGPVDGDTLFEAGSVSKTVFAYAVLKLVENGVLALDTPLTQYGADRWIEGDPRLDRITARHILSHTGGFQNWRSDTEPRRADTDRPRLRLCGPGYGRSVLGASGER